MQAKTTRKTGRKIDAGDHFIIDGGERTALVLSTGTAPYGQKVAKMRVEGGPVDGYEFEVGLRLGSRYEITA